MQDFDHLLNIDEIVMYASIFYECCLVSCHQGTLLKPQPVC
jgi:hypothetical protein